MKNKVLGILHLICIVSSAGIFYWYNVSDSTIIYFYSVLFCVGFMFNYILQDDPHIFDHTDYIEQANKRTEIFLKKNFPEKYSQDQAYSRFLKTEKACKDLFLLD